MEKDREYKIVKLDKGPLQRFKNQNLLIKKFGDVGTVVYRAITGKRTNVELAKDLDLDSEVVFQVLAYMEETGMIQLSEMNGAPEVEQKPAPEKQIEKTKEAEELSIEKEEPKKLAEKLAPEPDEIVPIETDIKPIEEETESKFEAEEQKPEEKESNEEVIPIEEKKEGVAEEKEEKNEEPEEIVPTEEKTEVEAEEAETPPDHEEEINTEQLTIREESTPLGEEKSGEPELSPVERIIKGKYGDVGIKVYTLIDGQRTAEEIMKETGLSESKLVEMLDFMDEEGIIKLEYPGDKKKTHAKEAEKPASETDSFKPMIDESETPEKEFMIKNPIEVPIRSPLNVVESLYLRTKTLMKFGDKGGKALEEIDGKKDFIDLALDNGITMYQMTELTNFLLEQKGIMLKPLGRTEIRKKYGDDGYSIYKKYGKDGIFLYELVGRDMKIKDMVKQIYQDVPKNKEKLAEMFMFIHQVLKIDLPVDKELLYREFGAM